ncbi:serine hydrolase family protein [Candidatus Peregrinibacteria bacterium]|nr:serine hydrolase family protein [Candidatus Peregrinibacteria bacterium]
MNDTVFIFHGVGGSPKENWFPWLKKELEQKGFRVIVPAFPNAEEPNQDEWLKHFERYANDVHGDTIFIGHSLGSAFALRMLELVKEPIRAAFLVGSVMGVMGNQFDHLMTTFVKGGFDWDRIRANAKQFFVCNSDNDPYITLEKGRELADHLHTKLRVVSGAGHFNQSSGYTSFEILKRDILSL